MNNLVATLGINNLSKSQAPDTDKTRNEKHHAAIIGAVMSISMLRIWSLKHWHHRKRCFRTGPTVNTEVPIPDTASAAAGPMALTTGAPMMYWGCPQIVDT